jgi:hypothetical protein
MYRILSWIVSVDISVLLKIYRYEYEYAKFSWILSMGSPITGSHLKDASHLVSNIPLALSDVNGRDN